MTHGRALAGMLIVTLMWSTAGVVSRQLEHAASFEVTFWRSLFTALSLGVYLGWQHGRGIGALLAGGAGRRQALWISGFMWSAMFTCFMVALTLTTVANVLITMSVAPLFTALLARFTLGHPVAPRTWLAILIAGGAIGWMYASGLSADPKSLFGSLVALGVPIAAAINWNTLQRSGTSVDLAPALLIGAVISCLVTLPLSMPFQASAPDIGWLALLGVFQLAVPCVMAVRIARGLSGPEIALLALLEIVFGIAWAWLGAGEQPPPQVLVGGAIVLTTLALNELVGMRSRRSRDAKAVSDRCSGMA